MARSQWICRTCGTGFETKERRDSHHKKEYENRSINPYSEVLNIRIRHSNDGRLTCAYGRHYQRAQSLNRHRTSCTQWILIQRPNYYSTSERLVVPKILCGNLRVRFPAKKHDYSFPTQISEHDYSFQRHSLRKTINLN